jgi:hypothetical protein
MGPEYDVIWTGAVNAPARGYLTTVPDVAHAPADDLGRDARARMRAELRHALEDGRCLSYHALRRAVGWDGGHFTVQVHYLRQMGEIRYTPGPGRNGTGSVYWRSRRAG